MKRALSNLVLNALSYGGNACVRLTPPEAGQLTLLIEDDGPGIPEAVRHRLFRPFASVGKTGGLGLGLAICAEIAKVHHGEISAESSSKGALFRIRLPVAGPAGLTPVAP